MSVAVYLYEREAVTLAHPREHQEALSTLSKKVTRFLDLNVGNANDSYRYSILFANKISATPWSLLKELLGNSKHEWSVIDD